MINFSTFCLYNYSLQAMVELLHTFLIFKMIGRELLVAFSSGTDINPNQVGSILCVNLSIANG